MKKKWPRMWKKFQNNPAGRNVGDCSVRAVAKALNMTWEKAYALIASIGFAMSDMPSSNAVTISALKQYGFNRFNLPNSCPDCYTIDQFCKDNPKGTFVVYAQGHVVCVADGDIWDSWDSSDEIVIYAMGKDVIPSFGI